MSYKASRGRRPFVFLGAIVLASTMVFWLTAYPTITWWDSASYSLAAYTLGITNAPGSLLLTLIGYPVAHLPVGSSPAHTLNLLAGLLAGICAALVGIVALRILDTAAADGSASGSSFGAAVGASLGALTFAFGPTLWEHAVKFTPYILSAVFTGLILLAMVRWWERADRPGAWRDIAMLTLLFGLDFSVHRTNAMLIPGAIAWILIRRARTLMEWRCVTAAMGGLLAGLSLQLAVIPISATTSSPLNMFEPRTLPRFWDYVSLANMGGHFLVDAWPRKSALWSVQIMDLLHVIRANVLHGGSYLGALGYAPAVATFVGIIALGRRDVRLAVALSIVVLLQAATTVTYFNIPANYFRSFDRHYLPVLVTLSVFTALGMGVVTQAAVHLLSAGRRTLAATLLAVSVGIPIAQLAGNWRAQDASRRTFAGDYAANALGALPPNAIYFTVGDNDTFPVMYLQRVEHVRPDVRIVNTSLANAPWYVGQLQRRYPNFPVTLSEADRVTAARTAWDTTMVVRVANADSAGMSVTLRPRPQFGGQVLPSDVVLRDIVATNRFRDPICFAITGGDHATSWLAPFARLDGLHWQIVVDPAQRADTGLLRSNLLDRYDYRGYADRSIVLEDVTRIIGMQYVGALRELLKVESARGESTACRRDAEHVFAALPPTRLFMSASEEADVISSCG